jgi:AAA ATPase domain
MSASEFEVLLLGRQAELERIAQRVDAGKPAVVLLVGEVGTGKTQMLRAAADRARAKDWRVVGDNGLGVDLETTERAFAERVQEFIGLSTDSTLTFGSGSEVEAHARLATVEAPTTIGSSFVRELARHAPLLLLVDGFRASEEFAEAFARFLARLRSTGSSIVVLVAGRDAELSVLLSAADEVIEVDRLAEEPVREYCERLAVKPPLTPEEIDAYVAESVKRPDRAVSLARVLALARTDGYPR